MAAKHCSSENAFSTAEDLAPHFPEQPDTLALIDPALETIMSKIHGWNKDLMLNEGLTDEVAKTLPFLDRLLGDKKVVKRVAKLVKEERATTTRSIKGNTTASPRNSSSTSSTSSSYSSSVSSIVIDDESELDDLEDTRAPSIGEISDDDDDIINIDDDIDEGDCDSLSSVCTHCGKPAVRSSAVNIPSRGSRPRSDSTSSTSSTRSCGSGSPPRNYLSEPTNRQPTNDTDVHSTSNSSSSTSTPISREKEIDNDDDDDEDDEDSSCDPDDERLAKVGLLYVGLTVLIVILANKIPPAQLGTFYKIKLMSLFQ